MQPILALLPEEKIIKQIFSLRKSIILDKLGSLDPRQKTLPHVSLVYLKSPLHQKHLKSLTLDCQNTFSNFQSVTLAVTGFQNWDNKISAIFNPKELTNLARKASDLFSKYKILDPTTPPTKIGDHIKIARNIKPDCVSQTIDYIKNSLPSPIEFNQLVLIDHSCTTKDILWSTPTKP